MYSTYKNKILKRLKYIIAGLLLITILPGNAGVKNNGHQPGSDFVTDTLISLDAGKESIDKVSNIEDEMKSEAVNLYLHQGREISPVGRSFNFFLYVQ